MALYSVGYDLNKDKNYQRLYDGINALPGGWAKPLKSHYVISYSGNTAQLRDYLQQFIDPDDSLFVSKFTNPPEAAWVNIPEDVVRWLQAKR